MSNDLPDEATRARQVARYLEMRAVTIQYLRMLEDELVAMRAIRPQDRACVTRQERRAMAGNYGDVAAAGV